MTSATPRQRIIDAAIDLFHRDGYNAASLRQISETVGLQVGSLYNHIASKEDLLFDIMHGVMLELLDETVREMDRATDPVGRMVAFLRTSIRFHALRQKETFLGNTELRGLSEEHRREIVALRDRYEGLLRASMEDCVRDGCLLIADVPLATRAAIALCTSVAVWYRPDGRLSLEDLETELPRLFGPLAQVDLPVGTSVRA